MEASMVASTANDSSCRSAVSDDGDAVQWCKKMCCETQDGGIHAIKEAHADSTDNRKRDAIDVGREAQHEVAGDRKRNL